MYFLCCNTAIPTPHTINFYQTIPFNSERERERGYGMREKEKKREKERERERESEIT